MNSTIARLRELRSREISHGLSYDEYDEYDQVVRALTQAGVDVSQIDREEASR